MADDDRDECRHENSCSCVKAREELQRRYDAVVAERDEAIEQQVDMGMAAARERLRAEKAERERDEAHTRARDANMAKDIAAAQEQQAERERDEARETIKGLRHSVDVRTNVSEYQRTRAEKAEAALRKIASEKVPSWQPIVIAREALENNE